MSAGDDEIKRKILEKTYIRKGADGQDVLGLNVGLPGRTVERARRCQNCAHFDTEERFLGHFHHCSQRDTAALRAHGASEEKVNIHLRKLRVGILNQRGVVGYCVKRIVRRDPQAATDFSSAGYLCDMWSGAFGLKVDTPIGQDKLSEELLDDLGETLPGKGNGTPEVGE